MILNGMSSSTFLNEILNIASNIVWKNGTEASMNELDDEIIYIEQFMTAKKGMLTFETVYKFNIDVLKSVGLSEDEAINASEDSSLIPIELRKKCTELQIKYIIENYEEMNNYYRMLYGLPDMDDTEFIYNTEYIDIADPSIPIHELSISELLKLEKVGYIDELIKKYPNKCYLNHLTAKKIEPYVARSGENFSILYLPTSEYDNLISDFKELYEGCRYSLMTYYTNILKKNNTYYDSFIALSILFMTIGLMHYKYLNADIDRDFYDKETIRYIYECYGLPFYSEIPLDYHIRIAKNMNMLLSYKGSTRVFYELFDLFGFGDTDIYEYYILKTHKFVDGKPVFVKKQDGTYDNKAMFDLKFGKVRLYDNPQLELMDTKNHIAYQDIVSSDPYWISDESLLDKLYEGEYNYKESKYLGIQTVYDITKIMYEGAYYFKMIFDNREYTELINVYVPFLSRDVSIFDLILYACALFGKQYGYCATISDSPHVVSKMLGFDFKKNMSILKDKINESDILKDDSGLVSLLKEMTIDSLESMNQVYTRIVDLRKYLVKKMCVVHERDEYTAYSELYNTLMYSEYIDDVYKLHNGKLASSFEELLSDRNRDLAIRLTNITDYEEELTNILLLLKTVSKDLKYIESVIGSNIELAISYLLKIINLLKSAKSELLGFNIVYTITARGENMMKYVCLIHQIEEESMLGNSYNIMQDAIELIHDLYTYEQELLNFDDELASESTKTYISSEFNKLTFMIKSITEIILSLKDNIDMEDFMKYAEDKKVLKDSIVMTNKLLTLYDVIIEILVITIKDEFESLEDKVVRIENKESYDSILTLFESIFIKDYDKFITSENLTDILCIPVDAIKVTSVQEYVDLFLSKLYQSRLNTTHDLKDIFIEKYSCILTGYYSKIILNALLKYISDDNLNINEFILPKDLLYSQNINPLIEDLSLELKEKISLSLKETYKDEFYLIDSFNVLDKSTKKCKFKMEDKLIEISSVEIDT